MSSVYLGLHSGAFLPQIPVIWPARLQILQATLITLLLGECPRFGLYRTLYRFFGLYRVL